jgi:3-methyladenine DNA glycosylase AlkC
MAQDYSPDEIQAARSIVDELAGGRIQAGIERLRALQQATYAAIPDKQRQSRGITWVLMRVSDLLAQTCQDDALVRDLALKLYEHLSEDDRLIGAAIFMMAEYGKAYPGEACEFFKEAGGSSDWVVREFAAAGLHKIIPPNREAILPWLQETAQSADPNLRRMVSEALRPVTVNRWLQVQPDYSLSVLRLMFAEAHPYPRTSVGNNLSDLSRRNPELIFGIVEELVATGDPNSYWIAQRACRNLVKADPERVMDLLGVDEYHYKDRHFVRGR